MGLDKGDDVGLQFGGGAMHTALQLLAGQFREPTFHLVYLAGRCRGEVDVPVRTAGQPSLNFRRLVRGVVVHHQMHVRPFRHRCVDFLRKSRKSVARWRLSHFSITAPVAMSSAANSEVVP